MASLACFPSPQAGAGGGGSSCQAEADGPSQPPGPQRNPLPVDSDFFASSAAQLHFPPSWPQMPVSRIDGIPKLRTLDEWKASPLRNEQGTPVKIVYALSANDDHSTAHHYIPEDVCAALSWKPLEHVRRYRQQDFGMRLEEPSEEGGWASADGEYAVIESTALALHLQYLFDQKHDHFHVVTVPLRLMELMLDLLSECLRDGWKGQEDGKDGKEQGLSEWARNVYDRKTGAAHTGDEKHALQQEHLVLVTKVWPHLLDSEVCVLPSVLLMDKKHKAQEWYELLSNLEREAKLTVYPRIEVESQMENKESYLGALMCSPHRFVDLQTKYEQWQLNFLLPELRKLEAQKLKYSFMPGALDAVRPKPIAKPPAAPAMPDELWGGRVRFVHIPHNVHTAPTVLLPDFRQFEQLGAQEQNQCIGELLARLQREVQEGEWNVMPNVWVLKGTNSTRSNVMVKCANAEELIEKMHAAAEKGMKLPGFILQPCMVGLAWECRSYFNRGQFMFSLLSDQAPEHGTERQTQTAFNTLEVRGNHRVSCGEYNLIQPQVVDFSAHILGLCEQHCKLVSESGVLRVDLGIEFKRCLRDDKEKLVQEEAALIASMKGKGWQGTGAGFIVRFFLNEVTSTLDINWFSLQTNYPILYEASYVTAQMLLHIADERRVAHGLKSPFNSLPSIHVRDPALQSQERGELHKGMNKQYLHKECTRRCAWEMKLPFAASQKQEREEEEEEQQGERSHKSHQRRTAEGKRNLKEQKRSKKRAAREARKNHKSARRQFVPREAGASLSPALASMKLRSRNYHSSSGSSSSAASSGHSSGGTSSASENEELPARPPRRTHHARLAAPQPAAAAVRRLRRPHAALEEDEEEGGCYWSLMPDDEEEERSMHEHPNASRSLTPHTLSLHNGGATTLSSSSSMASGAPPMHRSFGPPPAYSHSSSDMSMSDSLQGEDRELERQEQRESRRRKGVMGSTGEMPILMPTAQTKEGTESKSMEPNGS